MKVYAFTLNGNLVNFNELRVGSHSSSGMNESVLSSPYRSSYDFVGFIDGYLIRMPDDYLKKSIYGIAKECGLKII